MMHFETDKKKSGQRHTWILETDRLRLRELEDSDFAALCSTLQDDAAMYAYEGAFSDAEVREWLDRQIARYRSDGFGLWAVVLKDTGEFIGQCGLTMQTFDGEQVVEVGYLFDRAFWRKGYATEAARACKRHAFADLGIDEVFSIIRDTNEPSKRVAERNGMTICGSFVKRYRGIDMPHVVYSVRRTSEDSG